MKKIFSLICGLFVIFSCITVANAADGWPLCVTDETFASAVAGLVFDGKSIAVLVCDPFDAYINGNGCREVSYKSLSDLRDTLVMRSLDVRLMKGFQSDYYYLAFYDRVHGQFKGCIGDSIPGSQCVYRALDPTAGGSTNHTIKEIAGTGIRGVSFGSTVSKKYRISENRKNDVR